MKRLILIRHAKSSWDNNLSDLNRSLSSRGYSDAQIMSGIYNNLNINVDYVFSSTALRTQQTAEIFIKNINAINISNYNIDSTLYD